MSNKHVIYKQDNWNMMTVEVQGRYILLREISDQWGEECHTFLSRPALMHWVKKRFPEKESIGKKDAWHELMRKFKQV